MHSLSFIWYFASGWGFLTTFGEHMPPLPWEIDQNFCSLVTSPPCACTTLPPTHGTCMDRCIICLTVSLLFFNLRRSKFKRDAIQASGEVVLFFFEGFYMFKFRCCLICLTVSLLFFNLRRLKLKRDTIQASGKVALFFFEGFYMFKFRRHGAGLLRLSYNCERDKVFKET